MNLFDVYELRLKAALAALMARGTLPAGLDLGRVLVEPPRDFSHGDLATNAAMVLAKEARLSPRALADLIVPELRGLEGVTAAEVAGPGFINLKLAPHVFGDVLRAAVREGIAFGRSAQGQGTRVNVEYVSANPTGPMHVGHGRGAVFGDALCNLLAAGGYAVTREYYINDAGAQVDILARSAFLRYCEALGDDVGPIPEGLYPGDYLRGVGAALAHIYGPGLQQQNDDWLPTVREAAIDNMMAMIRDDLAALKIHHDVFFSERSLAHGPSDRIAATIAELREAGYVYEGRLAPPKGQPIEDWEDREQTLFRATAFGDDVDRPLLKSDGSYTYFAADIAYHRSKFERGFTHLIDIWGADHGGYVKRMQAAVPAVSGGKADLDVKLCQLVRLFRNGEPVRMSKRSGDFVTLREVIDEVGVDAVRFMMLYRKNDATLDFDLAKVLEQSKDNPVFYVQYAHARSVSVFRQAADVFAAESLTADALGAAPLELLTDPAEIDLIKWIAQYPRVVAAAAAAHEPHRIAFFLYELSSAFHSLWNKGKDMPGLRFINQAYPELTSARLALVLAVRSVVASGLAILGVGAPDEMR